MPSKEEIEILVEEAGTSLQTIQDFYGSKKDASAKVRFPRGFIRTANDVRSSLPNLGTEVQRRNASYALMKNDVNRWLAIRTDLSGTALSMVVKDAIGSLGGLCEWLTKVATRGKGSSKPYAVRTQRLVEMNIIDLNLKEELDWVWKIRCNSHIWEIDSLEHEMYSRADYNRALRAFKSLQEKLVQEHGKAQ